MFVLQSFASDCNPITDINTSEILKSIPIQDQDGTGLCYSFVGAQVLEFESKRQGRPHYVSPVDLAMKAGDGIFFDRSKLSSGKVVDTIKAAQKDGISNRDCIEKKIREFTHSNSISSAQFTKLIEVFYDEYEWFFDDDKKTSELLKKLSDEEASGDIGNRQDHLRNCDHEAIVKSLKEINLLGESSTKVLKKIFSSCPTLRVPEFKYDETFRRASDDDDNKMKSLIDAQLSSQSPAVVHLCAAALSAHDNSNYRKMDDSEKCGNHSLMAVGKREKAGRCEYLLRNSWGSLWAPPGVQCAFRTPDGTYYPDNSSFNQVYQNANDGENRRLTDQYKKRVNVGCWFAVDKIVQNTFGAGGIK